MSNAQHTPAPWEVAEAAPLLIDEDGDVFYTQAVFSLSDADIRPCRAQGTTAQEAEANACLIAAAPSMYAALEKANIKIQTLCQELGRITDLDPIVEIQAAIAKATREGE